MARRLRAYALTQGRTHATTDLALESLVFATDGITTTALGPEHRRIVENCATPRSLVDVAASLALPLGVVRVLIADLLDTGYLQQPAPTRSAIPAHQDLELLEEVLDGIESL